MQCRFKHNGKAYLVDVSAYQKGGAIILPDNTILDVGEWGESSPPVPMHLTERKGFPAGKTPAETAHLINGTLATPDPNAVF